MEPTKKCSRCDEYKPYSHFGKHATTQALIKLQSACKECMKARRSADRAANLEETRAKDLAAYYANHKARRASAFKYRAANGDKERAASLRWAKENPDKACARAARYRASKRRATVAWANKQAIDLIYTKSQRLSKWLEVEHHVDHIVPLKSKFVCGFHCEANLAIIPGRENESKNNRYWPDMWEKEDEKT